MKRGYFLPVLLLVLISSAASAIGLKDGFTLADMKTFSTKRLEISVLLEDEDYETLLALGKANLKDDYIKSLYAQKPENVYEDTIDWQMSAKFSRNQDLFRKPNQTNAARLYYAVRLNDTREIIGTFEIYGVNPLEFGLFIDKAKSHQGFGTEVLNAGIQLVSDKTTAKKVIWECNADNVGSTNVAKKCGFIFVRDWELYYGRKASTFALDLPRLLEAVLSPVNPN